MKKISITIMLSVLLVLVSRQPLCADEGDPVTDHLKIPLISSSSRILFGEDFRRITEIIAKSDDVSSHETARVAMPYSDKHSLVLWNLTYGKFYPLADWLYFPLYGGLAAGYAHGTAAFDNTSLLLGSGFLFNFEYLALGISVDISYDSGSNYALISDFPKYLKPGFGLYPVFNTGKFPFLRYLEKIAGEFSISGKDTESPDAIFENLAWVSKLVFNYLFKIPVFDLYVKSGKNDFFPEYDLSENYTGFKSLTYGGIIGTKTFSVEANYTMITGTIHRGKDPTSTDGQGKIIHYPFGLNGFPSLTLHWHPRFKESYWYLRFSTAQGMFLLSEDDIKKYPVIPTLGIASPTFEFFRGRKSVLLCSFSVPFVATMALEMYL
jgi:hypothetical protein